MELDILYTYAISFIPQRCHNSRSDHVRAKTTVTLRDVLREDTVPAFKVSGEGRFAPLDGRPREMLAWDGRLWLEWDAAKQVEGRFAEAELEVKGTPFDACHHLHYEYSGQKLSNETPATIQRKHPGVMREWHDDGGAGVATGLARRASDMIVVDGRVYIRDYEPVWENDYNDAVGVSVVATDPGDPYGAYYHNSLTRPVWRADRLSCAGKQPKEGHSIEVLAPDLVLCNDEGRRLVAAARAASSALHGVMDTLPAAVGDAFYDLREATEATRGGFGPAVVAALYRVHAVCAATGPDAIPAGRTDADKGRAAVARVTNDLGQALSTWEARPDDGREWQHIGRQITVTSHGETAIREVLDLETAASASRQLGIDLTEATSAAAAGRARLLVVEGARRWMEPAVSAAVLVLDEPSGPQVISTFGGGLVAEPARAALAAHFYDAANQGDPAAPSPFAAP